uniref:Uncharacterized protein n=1 Tax=Human herpesvirus 2 TaxID=10310 RepID=A0A481T4G8_HHV2|nr:hypothetical protein [Human alphaherpesvirus 2]QBH80136.1 hypothetical protein [Human alphaherpesvirus 2]
MRGGTGSPVVASVRRVGARTPGSACRAGGAAGSSGPDPPSPPARSRGSRAAVGAEGPASSARGRW